MQSRLLRLPLAVALATLLLCANALATWSIVIVNTRTGEVCVASATCLPNFNLRKATPVVIPGVGVAAAQSYLDGTIVPNPDRVGFDPATHPQIAIRFTADTILNDDGPWVANPPPPGFFNTGPAISIDDVSGDEGDSGTTRRVGPDALRAAI